MPKPGTPRNVAKSERFRSSTWKCELSSFRAGLVSFLSPCSHHSIRLHETQCRHTPKPWQLMGIRAICCSSILNTLIGLTNRNSHYILHPILQAWPQQTSVSLGTMHWALFHSTPAEDTCESGWRSQRLAAACDPRDHYWVHIQPQT